MSSQENPVVETITNVEDYELLMAEFKRIMAKDESKITKTESRRLEWMAPLIQAYEAEHFPMEKPDAIDMILFRMDQMGLRAIDLVPYIGSRGRVSEVLHRKRPLSLRMIVNLHFGLDMPYDHLMPQELPVDAVIVLLEPD